MTEVESIIPHRPPFLFVDEIVETGEDRIVTRRTWRADESFYEGHYPGNPLTPGVLLCEASFQSAAILLIQRARQSTDMSEGTPVLSRIQEARFKRMVRPGDTLEIEVTLRETQKKFHFLRAICRCEGKTALTLDFALALVPEEGEN